MAELGIDTASQDLAVAVVEGDRVLAERRWRIETTASKELLAGIDAVLSEAGVGREDLRAIAVNIGPGAYTALRTGVATAQGIALALDIPLAGVVRLEADAFPHLTSGQPVVAVHDAGRSGIAWAAYVTAAPVEAGPPEQLIAPRLDSPEECARLAPAGALWCGELSPLLREARDAAGRVGDTDVPEPANVRHAADLVRLARLHGAYGDPAAVDVMYLRPPPIGARARPGS